MSAEIRTAADQGPRVTLDRDGLPHIDGRFVCPLCHTPRSGDGVWWIGYGPCYECCTTLNRLSRPPTSR